MLHRSGIVKPSSGEELARELNVVLRGTTYYSREQQHTHIRKLLNVVSPEYWQVLLGCKPEQVNERVRQLGYTESTVEPVRKKKRQYSAEHIAKLRNNAEKARAKRGGRWQTPVSKETEGR